MCLMGDGVVGGRWSTACGWTAWLVDDVVVTVQLVVGLDRFG